MQPRSAKNLPASDEFHVLHAGSEAELKVQGSRFLAIACPVSDVDEAGRLLVSRRNEYHDATHHCFAYRLGPQRAIFRLSDDGEPSGTGGKPILAAIDHDLLTNTLVVVTRYFGGVKLGTGGLARAYGEAARSSLEGAKKEVRFLTRRGFLIVPHSLVGKVMNVLAKYGGEVIGSSYEEDVRLEVEIRASLADAMVLELRERTRGNVRCEGEFGR